MSTWKPIIAAAIVGASVPALAQAQDLAAVTRPGAYIQRSMRLLADATPQQRSTVRVLFYGQSITAGQWAKLTADDLKRRFPHANLLIENRAIGGFTAPSLIHTCEYDLYPHYPDLLIFHVYDEPGMAKFEEIIRRVRTRTTAEIVLATHHDVGRENDYRGSEGIRRIALKYQCGLVDIEKQWQATMAREGTQPKDYLADSVHHNKRGAELYASLMNAFLVRDPALPPAPAESWIKELSATDAGAVKRLPDGGLEVAFRGNRIDALAGPEPTAVAEVLIDGRQPSSFPAAYTPTRPSAAPFTWMPAFKVLGHQNPLVVEDWKLRVVESTPDGKSFRFRVTGTVTGDDGEGSNTQAFVSRSGRVAIEPGSNWMVAWSLGYRKKEMPADFEVRWQVLPRFVDRLDFPAAPGPGLENAVTLIQGVAPGPHTLRLTPGAGAKLTLRGFRVYQPPLTD